MDSRNVSVHVVADFTADSLAALLEQDPGAPRVQATRGSYNQVEPALLALADGTSPAKEAVIAWTRPEAVIGSFARLLRGEPVAPAAVLDEVGVYGDLLARAAAGCECLFVPTWTVPSHVRGLGLLDLKLPGQGVGAVLARMNAALLARLEGVRNAYPLDAARWLATVGEGSFNPRQWYLAKVPFTNEVFKQAVLDVKAGLLAVTGQARKLVVVDLDNTLWGGIVGDTGWEGLALGGHNAVGEAFVDFQRALKALKQRGILLGIVSKNDEAVALEAMTRHPEMALRPEDFAGWRISWNDKAQQLADLVQDLNLGLQSTVFIDDNPFERGRVRESLPEVLVPEWPANPMLYVRALEALRCFDAASLTAEDRERSAMYLAERHRGVAMNQAMSPEDWLRTLEMRVHVEPLLPANLSRVVQLLNKTNQMNLKTRRLTAEAFREWCAGPDRAFWAFRVSDRFGDSGLTALLSVERSGDEAQVVDFVVSCRVFKRGVEEAMVARAVEHCRRLGVGRLVAACVPTEKNAPTLAFWEESGFARSGDGPTWTFDTSRPYPAPAHIQFTETADGNEAG